MKKLTVAAMIGASCIAVAACSPADVTENTEGGDNAAITTEGGVDNGGAATTTASTAWPKGARIVEEKGVTYRIDPDGTRVALTSTDSRIVVEGDKRFRVDADGTRVRIDDDGGAIDIDVPDVDVGINEKGNPDIDVKSKDDGDTGPN